MRKIALLLMAAAVVACGDGGPGTAHLNEVSQTPLIASSPLRATSTPLATVLPNERPAVAVTGMFEDPRPTAVKRRLAIGAPRITFPEWDGESTMLYDMETGRATNLGQGGIGSFSPDGQRMAWVAGGNGGGLEGEVRVLDIATGAQQVLGAGRLAGFVDDRRIKLTSGETTTVVDLVTGDRTGGDGVSANADFPVMKTPDGYELREANRRERPYVSEWTLLDGAGSVLLRFDAYRAVPAGRGWLAVASAPVVTETIAGGFQKGTTNVFLIKVDTGAATFIATSPWSYANWPLAASDRYVVWTDDYCGYPDAGHTRAYDRTDRSITELTDASLYVTGVTDDDRLISGAFGPKMIFDLKTWMPLAEIPGVDTSSSADYRYMSAGQSGGHGGLCP